MAELLKDRYTRAYVRRLAARLHELAPELDATAFEREALGAGWATLELKQRMRRISAVIARQLPGERPRDLRRQLEIVIAAAPPFGGFEGMFFPDFVACHGLDDFDAATAALAQLTVYSSAEFAVRPFIIRYGERMVAVMTCWADSANEHVRRLASEGSRPRLPWGERLPQLVADPTPVLPMLARLRADPSESVRRSVANHLNDIAKDHPELVLKLARQWRGESAATDALLKHACRTLLKRGDRRALKLFGHGDAQVSVFGLRLAQRRLAIGETLNFEFSLRNDGARPAHLRIEYAIDYVKAAGHRNRKVFKIAERDVAAGQTLDYTRRQRLADLSTRRHHPGRHGLAVIVDGIERATFEFDLRAAPGV
jgi:3-methyladenine DNA glycosylase AlkC